MKFSIALALIFLTLLLFISPRSCRADDSTNNNFLRRSYLDSRKTIVHESGKPKGFLRDSNFKRGRVVQYDKKGNEIGYWRRDYVRRNRTIFFRYKNGKIKQD